LQDVTPFTQQGLVPEAANTYVKAVDFSAQLAVDSGTGVTNNRLSSVSRGGGNTGIEATTSSYVYDANGNLLEDDNHVYTYDVMNHQTAVYHKDMNQANHKGTLISQYFYDGEGERVGKEDYDASGQPQTYTQYLRSGGAVLWEETWQLPAMDSASGKTYVYARGRMAVVRESTQNASGGWDQAFEYFATDHLGTVRFSYKVDASGTLIASSTHDYEPFGLEIGPIETSDNTHRFTGHERDAETGNDYMHFRFYGANMGRFAKPDSNFDGAANNPQGWNLYSYVRGNPVNFSDPSGLKEKESERPAPMIGPKNEMGIVPSMSLDEYLWGSAHAGVTTTYKVTHNPDGSSTLTPVGTAVGATQANESYVSTGNYTVEGVTHYYYTTYAYENTLQGTNVTLVYHDLGVSEPGLNFLSTTPVEGFFLAGGGKLLSALGRALFRATARDAAEAAGGETLKLTDTVAGHLDRPYVNSPLTAREIMAGGNPIADPRGVVGALRWDVPGAFNGTSGTWELVLDPKTGTILHFCFVGVK
jgi:RHS repeat-associated protein